MTENYSSNKISYYRKKMGLTQKELRDRIYEATGRSYRQATISSWEKGNSAPPVTVLQEIGKILNVQVEDLYKQSILEDNNVVYQREIKAYQEVLVQAESEAANNPMGAYTLLKDNYNELLKKVSQLSDSNAKMKAVFNSISEMMKI